MLITIRSQRHYQKRMDTTLVQEQRILKEMTTNPHKVIYVRKGSKDSQDIISFTLNNPSFEKIQTIKKNCLNVTELKLTKVSDPSIMELMNTMDKLDSVDIDCLATVKGEVVQNLVKNLRRLRRLRMQVSNGALSEEDIGKISTHLNQLEKLQLYNTKVSTESATLLATGLCNLRSLSLPGSQLGDEQLRIIASNMKNLKELYIDESFVTPRGILWLAFYKTPLETLSISETGVSNPGIVVIASRIPTIRRLHLDSCKVSDRGGIYLSKLKNLKQLGLDWNSISNVSVTRLMHNLKKADLVNTSNNYLVNSKVNRFHNVLSKTRKGSFHI